MLKGPEILEKLNQNYIYFLDNSFLIFCIHGLICVYHEMMPVYSLTYFQWMVVIVYLFITLYFTPYMG